MDSVHHIWCPLSSQEFQDLPDGAETTLTYIYQFRHKRTLICEQKNNHHRHPRRYIVGVVLFRNKKQNHLHDRNTVNHAAGYLQISLLLYPAGIKSEH
ncbi:hypothetical protein E0401_19565 [Escherichia coli]|nr:hypothetical protein [Escherichia coli]EFA5505013.1 hypothetical protein [Escherichia coli]EFB5518745.1 hypothetical protein [Escherichia coli]EFD5310177.1 hypothetical protein [Escherichia coli]UMR72776.1 hypothetical protein AOY94_21460 [Escherichia coli]